MEPCVNLSLDRCRCHYLIISLTYMRRLDSYQYFRLFLLSYPLNLTARGFFFADLHKAERGMKLGLPMKINSISLATFCPALKKLEDIELIAK